MATIRKRIAKISDALEKMNNEKGICISQEKLDEVKAMINDIIVNPDNHRLTSEEYSAIMDELRELKKSNYSAVKYL